MTSESTSHDCTRPIQVTEDLRIRPYNEEDIDDLYPRLLAEQDELFMIGSIAGMKSVNDLHLEIDRSMPCSEQAIGSAERSNCGDASLALPAYRTSFWVKRATSVIGSSKRLADRDWSHSAGEHSSTPPSANSTGPP